MAVSPQHTGANHNYSMLPARGIFFEIDPPQPCACQVSGHGCKDGKHEVKVAHRYTVDLHLGLLQLAIC